MDSAPHLGRSPSEPPGIVSLSPVSSHAFPQSPEPTHPQTQPPDPCQAGGRGGNSAGLSLFSSPLWVCRGISRAAQLGGKPLKAGPKGRDSTHQTAGLTAQNPEPSPRLTDRRTDVPQPADRSPEPAQWGPAAHRLQEAWTPGSLISALGCHQSDPGSGPRNPRLPGTIFCPQQLEGLLGPAENWAAGEREPASRAGGGPHRVSATGPAGSGPGDVQGCAVHPGEGGWGKGRAEFQHGRRAWIVALPRSGVKPRILHLNVSSPQFPVL